MVLTASRAALSSAADQVSISPQVYTEEQIEDKVDVKRKELMKNVKINIDVDSQVPGWEEAFDLLCTHNVVRGLRRLAALTRPVSTHGTVLAHGAVKVYPTA